MSTELKFCSICNGECSPEKSFQPNPEVEVCSERCSLVYEARKDAYTVNLNDQQKLIVFLLRKWNDPVTGATDRELIILAGALNSLRIELNGTVRRRIEEFTPSVGGDIK